MSGIILKKTDAADIPTPATDKATLFLDDVTGEPTLKDDTGATSSLVGPAGPAGPSYTDEQAQDAVGAMIVDTATVNLTYTDATPALTADVIPGGIKLDDLGTPDDNTDLNASTSRHGLLKKLSNVATEYMDGTGNWSTPAGGGGGGGGAITRITETVVGAGGSASITFSSIVNTYRHLWVRIHGRGEKSATFASLRAQFNGLSTGIHDVQISNQNNTTYAGGAAVAQTYFELGYITADTAPAGSAAMTDLYIGDYKGTTFHKSVHAFSQLRTSTAAGGLWLQDMRGWWLSTAAITDILLFADSGDFAEGTVATLYGIS